MPALSSVVSARYRLKIIMPRNGRLCAICEESPLIWPHYVLLYDLVEDITPRNHRF